MAQLVERPLCKRKAAGANPAESIFFLKRNYYEKFIIVLKLVHSLETEFQQAFLIVMKVWITAFLLIMSSLLILRITYFSEIYQLIRSVCSDL